jgi:NAD(P)-dependent dehydrogenase (short-subunit alcohol dehydrogenase family)
VVANIYGDAPLSGCMFPSMTRKKIVMITGCSQGLGEAMAREFAASGWAVAGCARPSARLGEMQQRQGATEFLAPCDVADDAQVKEFCAEVVRTLGVPDLVLNNAAIVNRNAMIWDVPAEEFDRVVDINVKGPANVMRHILPAMMARGSGVIVNFSSGWGRSTSPEVAPYCATKWAIEGLSQAVAQETDGKVAVVAVNPGIIDTRMLRSCFGAGAASYRGPAEWARTAAPFLMKLGPRDNGRALTAP